MARKASKLSPSVSNRVTVLIPVYDEVKILGETVDYYSHIAAEPGVRVVFVTTGREGDAINNPSLKTIEGLIKQLDNVAVLHYPYVHGAKAAQLNWAMEKLGAVDHDYFAIFDADSRPDIAGLKYVTHSEMKPEIFQMPGCYLPHSSNSLASQAMSVFQSRWSLSFEIPKWRAWQNRRGGGRIMYVVGHGLFINPVFRFSADTLTEDLELGYKLSANANSFALVPYFDYGSVPKSFGTAIVQSSRWFYGEFVLPKFCLKILGTQKEPFNYLLWFIVRYSQIMLWMMGPILALMALIASVGNALLLTLNITSIVVYCYVLHYLTCRYLSLSYKSLLLMPIKTTINGLGPLLCVLYIVLDRLGVRKNTFVKTTR